MKVLVSGAAGYLGSSLVPFLRSVGHHVEAVDNFHYGQAEVADKVQDIYRADVNHPSELYEEFVEWADCVVHLAAIVGAPACDLDPTLARATNLDSVKWLTAKLRPDQLLVLPCTNSGYGKSGATVCTELTPLNSLSLYGKLKEEAEKIVMKRKKSVSLRLATVFGVSVRQRLDLLVNHLTYDAFFAKRISLFDGDFRRNYIHVKDVCAGIDHVMMHKDCHGEIFNLGNDKANCTKSGLVSVLDDNMLFQLDYVDKEDPDQRDYEISSAKLKKFRFEASISLDSGVKELMALFETFPPTAAERLVHTATMRNM